MVENNAIKSLNLKNIQIQITSIEKYNFQNQILFRKKTMLQLLNQNFIRYFMTKSEKKSAKSKMENFENMTPKYDVSTY